jgi:hypothetical protein
MNEQEKMQCMFCGAVCPDVCAGLTPEPGCRKPGLDALIAAHTRTGQEGKEPEKSGD